MEALSQLHWIRPGWFAALPVLLTLVWLSGYRQSSASGWHRLIDPALLTPLLEPATGHSARAPYWLAATAAVIAVIGLAGPSIKKLPQPTYSHRSGLVIVLDLSPSMQAQDTDPDRITFARRKIRDILAQRGDGQTALVVYSGDAHIVTPLTDDIDTIALFLPSLQPSIMPATGNQPLAGFRKAAELAAGGSIEHPEILWITDGLPVADASVLRDFVRSHGLHVSVLGIGSKDGAPIPRRGGGFVTGPNGDIAIAHLDSGALENWAASVSGRFAPAVVGDADIRYLLAPLTSRLGNGFQRRTPRFDQWRDSAAVFALALLPIALLAFRRGWILLLCVVLLPPHADAFSFDDLWQRPDQQGIHELAQGKPAAAAKHFHDPAWRGAALYRAGKYTDAAHAFTEDHSVDSYYNRGNALTRAGKLSEALEAYRQALKANPNDADAQHNEQLVKQLQKQRRKQQQLPNKPTGQSSPKSSGNQGDGNKSSSSPDSQQQPNHNGKKPGQNPSSGDRQSRQSQGRPTTAPPPAEGQQRQPAKSGKRGQQKVQANGAPGQQQLQQAPGAAHAGNTSKGNDAETQLMNQWLRQIPDDPGELLHRKFEYEYRRDHTPGESDRDDQRY